MGLMFNDFRRPHGVSLKMIGKSSFNYPLKIKVSVFKSVIIWGIDEKAQNSTSSRSVKNEFSIRICSDKVTRYYHYIKYHHRKIEYF